MCCHNFSSACSALMNDLNIISQLNETALANILFYAVLSNIYMQQNDLMNHSSKGLSYIYDLYYFTFFSLVVSWRHVICGVQRRSTTPRLNYHKGLKFSD